MGSMEDAALLELFESLTREISGVNESLSGQIATMRKEMKDGFDRVEARVARHGGMLRGGAVQISRLIDWSEKVDTMIAERDASIAELTRRVEKLEGNA
jgi:hypothetical protein